MSQIPTTAIFVTKSGSNWTLDVTLLNLSDILPLKDFQVVDVAAQLFLNNNFITKTSSTVLTYSGPDIGVNIALEVRRNTPIDERYYPIPHGAYLNSQALNEELDRILRKLNEIEGFPGSVLGAFILDQAYGPSWATDNITSRTAQNIYEKVETLAPKVDALLESPMLVNGEVFASPNLLSDSLAIANTAWVKALQYASAASVTALANSVAATPTYKRIGRFTGNGAAVGTLDLTAVPGTIEGDRLYYEFKGVFANDVSIFVRPNEIESPTSNAAVQSTSSVGTPTYNSPAFGSYVNSFWIGYCENAANSRLWGKGTFQWLSSEVHSVSNSMMHSPGVRYGIIDIHSLSSNAAYVTPKVRYTIFGVDVATGLTARAIPASFTFDVFAYVTP